MPKTVSFIIPALNEASNLLRLLHSIKNLKLTPDIFICEVIVVDAESTDNTTDIAADHGCKIITAKPGNASHSRNAGAAKASGDILAFIDADCELPDNWLINIMRAFQINDKIVAAGAKLAESSDNASWVERTWYELTNPSKIQTDAASVPWLATFNLAVKKSAFDDVAGFNHSLITCEDVEIGYRLSNIGQLVRINDCGVAHHGESKTVVEFYRREAWRAKGAINLLRHHRKNASELLSFMLPIIMTAGMFVSIACLTTYVILFLTGHTVTTSFLLPTFAVIVWPLPVILFFLYKGTAWKRLLPGIFLLSVYFFARTHGTFFSFSRLERSANT